MDIHDSNSSNLFSDHTKLIEDSLAQIHSKYSGFNISELKRLDNLLYNLTIRVNELNAVQKYLTVNPQDQIALKSISQRIIVELDSGSGLVCKIQKFIHKTLIQRIKTQTTEISSPSTPTSPQDKSPILTLVSKWIKKGKTQQVQALIGRIKDPQLRNQCYSFLIQGKYVTTDFIPQEHQESWATFLEQTTQPAEASQDPFDPIRSVRKKAAELTGVHGFSRKVRKAAANATGLHHVLSPDKRSPTLAQQPPTLREPEKTSKTPEISANSSSNEIPDLSQLETALGKDLSHALFSIFSKDGISSFRQEGAVFHFTLKSPIRKELPKGVIKSLLPKGDISMKVHFPEMISIQVHQQENSISFLNPEQTVYFHDIRGNDLTTRMALKGEPTSLGLQKILIDKESGKGGIKLFLTSFSENKWLDKGRRPRLDETSFTTFWTAIASDQK